MKRRFFLGGGWEGSRPQRRQKKEDEIFFLSVMAGPIFMSVFPFRGGEAFRFSHARPTCYGGVIVPSRSHRSSQVWPSFHRKT